MSPYNCIVVLGPTASGKTNLACKLANALNGEIISADSRQVYKHLNIGTGKDLEEYQFEGKQIPYHLIDVVEPNTQFYLHDFVEQLKIAYNKIISNDKLPIICGGTGLYLDTLRKDFSLTQIKENTELRTALELLSKEDLTDKLKQYPNELWHQVDLNSKKRIMRGIEIADFLQKNKLEITKPNLPYKPFYVGILNTAEQRREKIYARLIKRINEGLIEEVEELVKCGISHERLQFLGLEYKFVSNYLLGNLNKEALQTQLSTAINQFAKRQMTWFRKMEKEGVTIHWIESAAEVLPLIGSLQTCFNTNKL